MKELEILKKMGLAEYESKIVIALLRLGPATVKDIFRECNVPKNKIYESLNSLNNKGIVDSLPTTPKKYLIKNNKFYDSLIKEKEEEIKLLKKESQQLKKISQLSYPFSTKEAIWIVYGHEAFVNKIKEAISKTNTENLILAKSFKSDTIIFRLTKEAIKRGSSIRMLIPQTKDPKIKDWLKIGVKIKYLEETPRLTFSIFDKTLCRLNLEIQNNIDDPTLWIESPPFIQILHEKFEQLWKTANS